MNSSIREKERENEDQGLQFKLNASTQLTPNGSTF